MIKYLLNYHKTTRKLNYKTIVNFFKAKYRQYKTGKKAYELEQYDYRMLKAPLTCALDGMCPCFCDFPDVLWGDLACESGCYPDWMNEEEWEQFKKDNNIDTTQLFEAVKLRNRYVKATQHKLKSTSK